MKRIVHDVKNNIKYEQECGKEIKSFSIAIADTYHIFSNFISDIYLINSVDEFNFFKEDDPANHISDTAKKFFEFVKDNATCNINITNNAIIAYTKSGAIITITTAKSVMNNDIAELNVAIHNISYETAVAIEQQLSITFTVEVKPEYKETTRIDLTKVKVEDPDDAINIDKNITKKYEDKHLVIKKSYDDILSLKEDLLDSLECIYCFKERIIPAIKDCLVRDISHKTKCDFKQEDYDKYHINNCETHFDTDHNIHFSIIFKSDADRRIVLTISKYVRDNK